MKKAAVAAAAAVLVVLVLLVGCGKERETPTVRIGVAHYQQEDTFLSTVVQNLEQLARTEEQERGIKINLNVTDARGSQSAQNEQVDTFLQQGCDVICVNLVDRTAAAVIVDKAQAAGVPVIFFNREPVEEDLDRWENAYYVGTPAEEAGLRAGDVLIAANGQSLNAVEDLVRLKQSLGAGDAVSLTYVRDGQSYTASVALIDPDD